MASPKGFKAADLGGEPDEVICNPEYRAVTITWSKPKPWLRDEEAPISGAEDKPGYLYAISWDHHRAARKETIAYIGITKNLERRFLNHPAAEELLARKRKTFLSIGHVDFGRYKTATTQTRKIIEELEHIFIWTLWSNLINERKVFCIPGFGTAGGRAWHVTNDGHRFSGRMPLEIIYPWILVKPGRDRSYKAI